MFRELTRPATGFLVACVTFGILLSSLISDGSTARAECSGVAPRRVQGYSPPLSYVQSGGGTEEDGVRNWDFECNTDAGGTPNRIDPNQLDWPVSIVFMGDANTGRVRDRLALPGVNFTHTGSGVRIFGRVANSSPWSTSTTCTGDQVPWCFGQSKGSKTDCTYSSSDPTKPSGSLVHVRFYAPASSDDGGNSKSMYNPTWGFYVIATTHLDRGGKEPCPGSYKTGWNDDAAYDVYAKWAAKWTTGWAWWASQTLGNNEIYATDSLTPQAYIANDSRLTWLRVADCASTPGGCN